MKFNINEYVSFRLTPAGKKLVEKWIDKTIKPHESVIPDAVSIFRSQHLSGADARFQMWEFMRIFGPHMFNGAPQYIEQNVIEIQGISKRKES